MKFHINPPPSSGSGEKRIDNITSWLFQLTENLNIVLNCLSEDNFSADTRKTFENIRNGENNDI